MGVYIHQTFNNMIKKILVMFTFDSDGNYEDFIKDFSKYKEQVIDAWITKSDDDISQGQVNQTLT